MKSEKPKWFFNKFLKAKYENKKKFYLIIKNSENVRRKCNKSK